MPKKYKKTRFFCPKLGGGKLVRFLEFDNFGSKLGGEVSRGGGGVGSFTSVVKICIHSVYMEVLTFTTV